MFSVIFGAVINALGGSPTIAELVHQVDKVHRSRHRAFNTIRLVHQPCFSCQIMIAVRAQVCLYFIYLAIVAFVASYGEIGLWMWTGMSAVTVPVAACQSMHLDVEKRSLPEADKCMMPNLLLQAMNFTS